jgi:hypothetical protein
MQARRALAIATTVLALAACGDSVFEVLTEGTRRPIRAQTLRVEIDLDSPLDPQRHGVAVVDAQSRYGLRVPDGRFIKVTSVDTLTPGRWRFCATNTIMRGDTVLDVNLYAPEAPVPGPILSGQVFAVISGVRTPVISKEVYFKSRGFAPDVAEITDGDGRYSFCGIPSIPGELYMVCGNDVSADLGGPVEVRTDTVIDIDATEFYTCL